MILLVEKETDVQRGLEVCYRSQNREVAEVEYGPSWSEIDGLESPVFLVFPETLLTYSDPYLCH